MADTIRISLSRRCAGQVARMLRETVTEARSRAACVLAPNAAADMAAVLAVAEDIERQLGTQRVEIKVLAVGPYEAAPKEATEPAEETIGG